MKLRAIDLFSGCGGLTLGLKKAGFRVIGAIENDALAVETYKGNHRLVEVWAKDIRKVSPRQVMRQLRLRPGQLDLLAGCPPCQGFSTMTTLNGHVTGLDSRNDLVFEFIRFVRALKPKALMLENVPGLAKDARLHRIVRELKCMGYVCTFGVLNAADYGVAQRRRRFVLLAGRNKEISFAKQMYRRVTVRDALRFSASDLRRDPLHNIPERRTLRISRLIKKIPHNGGSRNDLHASQQLDCHRRCDGFKDVYGRMAWNKVAPTITGGCFNPSKGRFLHPTSNRTISLREAALLQSFPANYFFSLKGGKSGAAQLIGNALPPEFVRRHAKMVASALTTSSNKDRR